ncbi:MAG: hypothetical protein KDK26_15615 [Roseivivax sp.]|nr:hypothetical protein [Roseivivax sp.]
MIPQFVIADRHPIDISIRGFEHKDSDPGYYQTELTNLRRVYDREIRGRFRASTAAATGKRKETGNVLTQQ